MNNKNLDDYVPQSEAQRITRLRRTQLYKYRRNGVLSWTTGITRGVLYYKPDLLKLIGLN